MDMDDELKRLKWLLISGVVFLISAFFSWREMTYAISGKEVDASLVRVYETTERGRRGRTIHKLAVEYEFKGSDGVVRKESDTISVDAPRPAGPTVAVQYLDGEAGRSRLAGNTQKFWLMIFFGSLAFIGYKIFKLVREAKT